MKRILTLAFVLAAVAATAATALAADYDRYERGAPPPPPPRAAYAPPPQHAAHGQPYFFAHLGLFEPNDDSDGLTGYDSGGAFDVGIGSRVSPFLAIEGTFGAFGADRGDDELAVAPVTFGVRLIVPHPFIEPYVGAGVGLYFASIDGFVGPPNNLVFVDDSDTTFGGYASIGLDAWLNRRVALNFEGRYHWAEPQFDSPIGSLDVNVGGWTASMGVRVSF